MTESGETLTRVFDASHTYLGALLSRIRAHSQVIRFHLGEQDQNTTLGLAAEMGIRDMIRQVLPNRFGVTSGFMCLGDGRLIDPAGKDDVSPQTDVILYDASCACPLYKMGEVEVVTAKDVLGIFEVKDRANGEDALDDATKITILKDGTKSSETTPGALRHVGHLAKYAPAALRVVILFRGDEKLKVKPPLAKAKEKCEKFDQKEGFGTYAPHIIYCIQEYYIIFHEYLTNQLHFIQYEDPTSALADFLHVVTSYFVAQQLSTTSSSLGLLANSRKQIVESLDIKGRTALKSLRDEVWNHYERSESRDKDPSDEDPSMLIALRAWAESVKQSLELYCLPATGKAADGRFTSGMAIVARWKDNEAKLQVAGSFFVVNDDGFFECFDPEVSDGTIVHDAPIPSWIIAHERIEAYLLRIGGKISLRTDPFSLSGKGF